MSQVSWLNDTSDLFRFFTYADAAIIEYLQTYAPNGLAALLATVHMRRTILTEPTDGDSKGGFPLVYVWTAFAEDQYLTPNSPMVTVTTRFLVFDLHTEADMMVRGIQQTCGAIASALRQVGDSATNDWKAFYCNWREGNQPEVSISNMGLEEAGDTRGFARGEVSCTWTHYE